MMRCLLALLVAFVPLAAVAAPTPPCGVDPEPAFGTLDRPPTAGTWSADQLQGQGWRPAACLDWTGDSKLVTAVASRFRSDGDVFERLTNVSAWPAIRYWSISRQHWQPLVAGVRIGQDAGNVLAPGHALQFMERDENGGETTYRMRILERAAQRAVVATENVTAVRISMLTAFDPGALQTVSFVHQGPDNSWSTYQILRVGSGGSSLVLRHPGSFLNRLEAIRRYLAGQPTDQQSPLAPR